MTHTKPERDCRLGALAVAESLVSKDDVQECLAEQRRLSGEGIQLRIGQIMVRKDLISTTQLVRLLDLQRTFKAGR